MRAYIARRLLLIIPTLIGISLLVTALMRLLPGDAVDLLVNENSSAGGSAAVRGLVDRELAQGGIDPISASFEQRNVAERAVVDDALARAGRDPAAATDAERKAARDQLAQEEYEAVLRHRLGLDRSFIGQWWSWSSGVLRGDLGTSLFGNRDILADLRKRVPVTLELGLLAIVLATLIALPVGVIAAARPDSALDYLSRGGAIAMLAVPSFFMATLVIALAARFFGYSFPLKYAAPWDDLGENIELIFVPALILAFGVAGPLMRLTRTAMLEVLRQDYMRTARAKGLTSRSVLVGHGARNALIPVVTVIGLQVPLIIGGSLVMEQIFGLPGVAQYLFDSIRARDFPPIMAVNLLVAIAIMTTNLAVDVVYACFDPRIRFR